MRRSGLVFRFLVLLTAFVFAGGTLIGDVSWAQSQPLVLRGGADRLAPTRDLSFLANNYTEILFSTRGGSEVMVTNRRGLVAMPDFSSDRFELQMVPWVGRPRSQQDGFFVNARTVRMHGGGAGAGQRHEAKGRRDAGHGGSRAHHTAGAGGGGELAFQFADPLRSHFARAITRPIAPAIGAGGKPLTFKSLRQHRPGDEHHRRNIGRNRGHQLRRHGLVAATHQHRRIHRLGGKHRFRIQRHQVAIMHGTGAERWLTQADRRKAQRQRAFGKHATAHRFNQLRHGAVAVIVIARGIGDADHGLVQHALRIAHGFGEGPPEIKREIAIPVIGGIAAKAMGFVAHAGGSSERVAGGRQIKHPGAAKGRAKRYCGIRLPQGKIVLCA